MTHQPWHYQSNPRDQNPFPSISASFLLYHWWLITETCRNKNGLPFSPGKTRRRHQRTNSLSPLKRTHGVIGVTVVDINSAQGDFLLCSVKIHMTAVKSQGWCLITRFWIMWGGGVDSKVNRSRKRTKSESTMEVKLDCSAQLCTKVFCFHSSLFISIHVLTYLIVMHFPCMVSWPVNIFRSRKPSVWRDKIKIIQIRGNQRMITDVSHWQFTWRWTRAVTRNTDNYIKHNL